MVKPTGRRQRQFAGGLLLGTLGVLVWVARRHLWTSAEQRPFARVEPSDSKPDGEPSQDLLNRRYKPRVQWGYVIAATIILLAAVIGCIRLIADIGVRRWALIIFAVGLLVLSGVMFVFPHLLAPSRAPDDLAGVKDLSAMDRVEFADESRKHQNDIRTAMLQTVAGVTVLAGLLFTWQQQLATSKQIAGQSQQAKTQLELDTQGQAGERFSRAIGQLGDDTSMDVRLGGLYELEQLARQHPKDRLAAIVRVAAAFAREHAQPDENPSGSDAPSPPADAAEALVIARRLSNDEHAPIIDLTHADFHHLDLAGSDFTSMDFSRSNLRKASLYGAVLHRASFVGADLRGVNLECAKLQGAALDHTTRLRGAITNKYTQWPEGYDPDRAGVIQAKKPRRCP